MKEIEPKATLNTFENKYKKEKQKKLFERERKKINDEKRINK